MFFLREEVELISGLALIMHNYTTRENIAAQMQMSFTILIEKLVQ